MIKKLIRKEYKILCGMRGNFSDVTKEDKKIFHLSIPSHGNMGDQAIAYATYKFLRDNFPEYKIIEVYRDDIYEKYYSIKKILNKEDIIVTIGGGNMGNLWTREEIIRRFIFEKFKNNKIISMPQTISFTQDEEGKKELEKSKKIYCNNKI